MNNNDINNNLPKPHLVGVNHVALEVGNIDDALNFYGKIFNFKLRGRTDWQAFIDMGDQFIALMETASPQPDREKHFGLVVDDQELVKQRLADAGVECLPDGFLDFLDPWGNRVQIVEYREIQFTKTPHVLAGMGLSLDKSAEAIQELTDKGMAPDNGRT